MNDIPDMPSHERLNRLFAAIELGVSASEIHGVICGLLSAGQVDAHADWFAELFSGRDDGDLLVQEARQLLGRLYQASGPRLADAGLGFQPLLPGDEQPLRQRAKALSQWCQGYLYGLGLAGMEEQQLQGDAREVVADLGEITRLDYTQLPADEVAEGSYMELVEFLRVAVLLVREALTGLREGQHGSE